MSVRFLPWVAVSMALAGCAGVGDGGKAASLDELADAVPDVGDLVSVLVHEGYVKAGGAFEITDHWQPSEGVTRPVWKAGFNLDIVEVPQKLEVRQDWEGTGRMMMMVHPPEGANRDYEVGWAQYFNPGSPFEPDLWPETGPLCMQIPPEDLVAGHWHWMAHSQYAVDLKITWTITTVAGIVEVPPGFHGHPTNAEEIQNAIEADGPTKYPPREWLPCELSDSTA